MNDDAPTIKEKANLAVERHLAELAEMAPLREGHAATAREALKLYVASEDIDTVAAELEQHVDADTLDALVNGDRGLFREVLSTLEEKSPAWRLARDLLPLRFHVFSYQPVDSGEGRIYVGREGEKRTGEDLYAGVAAESAHHLLHTLHFDAHGSVSEFYEFALGWWTEPLREKFFQHGYMDFRLETAIVESWDAGGIDYFDLMDRFLAKVLAEPEGHQRLSTFFWMASGGYAENDFDIPFIPSKMGRRQLEGEVFEYLRMSVSRLSFYQEAHAIAWNLLENIMSTYGLSLEEAHEALTVAAVEALYDQEGDFSSRRGYLETVNAKLPEYLDNG